MEKVILWDKDSTLANTYHRQHMLADVKAGKKTWEEWDQACMEDTPLEGAVTLFRLLSPYYRQIVVSGAHQSAEVTIRKWARLHAIPIEELILRQEGDRSSNAGYKASVVQDLREQGLDVVLFVEDFPKVAAKMKPLRVPVLLVNPDYPPDAPHNNMQAVLSPSGWPPASDQVNGQAQQPSKPKGHIINVALSQIEDFQY
jgi:hypothetical protein